MEYALMDVRQTQTWLIVEQENKWMEIKVYEPCAKPKEDIDDG
jgi:hypothetical protein